MLQVVADLDDVTFDVETDGEQVRREVSRRVWQHAGWATVAIVFEERDADGGWKPAKLALVRLRRIHDAWRPQGTITLRGGDALELAEALEGWRAALTPQS
jgi:hypothetical protein